MSVGVVGMGAGRGGQHRGVLRVAVPPSPRPGGLRGEGVLSVLRDLFCGFLWHLQSKELFKVGVWFSFQDFFPNVIFTPPPLVRAGESA